MPDLDLSVIILSYNTKEITSECLTHLKESIDYTQPKLDNKIETIVIDNASTDGSVEMIKKDFPWVKLIVSKVNTGFSGGNNIGMKASTKPFVLLLNSDAFVQKETLSKALSYFADHQECDLLGCQLHFKNGKLQPSAGYLPRPLNTLLWISGLALLPIINKVAKPIHPRDPGFFKTSHQAEWVMGAFLMLKRAVYEKTGGFDESIFMYGEEVEWLKRIQDHGFKLFYVPEIVITHLDKASSNFMIEKPLVNEVKGIVRYFHQHYPSEYPWIKIGLRLSLWLRIIIFSLLGKSDRRRAYIQALGVL